MNIKTKYCRALALSAALFSAALLAPSASAHQITVDLYFFEVEYEVCVKDREGNKVCQTLVVDSTDI